MRLLLSAAALSMMMVVPVKAQDVSDCGTWNFVGCMIHLITDPQYLSESEGGEGGGDLENAADFGSDGEGVEGVGAETDDSAP